MALTDTELARRTAGGKMKRKISEYFSYYLLLLPFVFFYGAFTLYPLVHGFIVSFYDWKILGEKQFIGLQNYIKIFHDSVFYSSMWHTILFVLISTPVIVVAGFLFACIVHQPLRGKTVYRLVFFVPIVLSVSVVASVWSAVLDSHTGMLNSIIKLFGSKGEILWLSHPTLAWLAVIVITLWWTVGFNMILYLAGLQEIPDELYEAAKMDGANAWKSLLYITIPALNRITVLITFLQIIASFKIFSQVYLVTQGGPAGATRTIIQYIYEEAFKKYSFGPASAMSYIFCFVLLIISMIQLRISKERE